MNKEKPVPVHPGEIIREEFLKPMQIDEQLLCKRTGIPKEELEQLLAKKIPITEERARKLSGGLHTSWELWMWLQEEFECFQKNTEENPDDHKAD